MTVDLYSYISKSLDKNETRSLYFSLFSNNRELFYQEYLIYLKLFLIIDKEDLVIKYPDNKEVYFHDRDERNKFQFLKSFKIINTSDILYSIIEVYKEIQDFKIDEMCNVLQASLLYLLDKSFIYSKKLTIVNHNIYDDMTEEQREIITAIKNKERRYSFVANKIDNAILGAKQQIFIENVNN